MQIQKEKKRKKKYLFCIPAIMLILCSCGNNFFTQFYEFPRLSKEQLIEQINYFKSENPQYKLIHLNSDGVYEEEPDEEGEYQYYVYFYFPDTDQTVHCVILQNNIGFRGISKGTDFRDWKRINTKDLTKKEDDQIKLKFEQEILNKINVTWKRIDDGEGFKRFVSGINI